MNKLNPRFVLILILYFLGTTVSHAQNDTSSHLGFKATIIGTLKDSTGRFLPFEEIYWVENITLASAFIAPTSTFRTDSLGNFILETHQSQGALIIKKWQWFIPLKLQNGNNLISLIVPSYIKNINYADTGIKTLQEVFITYDKPVSQKGDTTSFNAGAFKVNKDATTEDLITKMPGISMQDGKVQAQGEQVQRILVDGKPFMGDDPNAVIKNLPAEAVERVEVFDRKSDQSAFTGFDDGNNSKTINIVTRPQFRNGIFGRVYVGSSFGLFANETNSGFNKAGFNINFFKDKRRISVLYQGNNTNEQNFSTEDLLGVIGTNASNQGGGGRPGGGGGGRPGGRGPGGSDNEVGNFLTDQKNGINKTHALGINYSNTLGKKTDISASYFFNFTNNFTLQNAFRNYITGSQSGLTYAENKIVVSDNSNHRLSGRVEHKFTEKNSLLIQPRISVQLNSGLSEPSSFNRLNAQLLSSSESRNLTDYEAYNASIPILWRYAFAKDKRTISLQATPGWTMQKGNSTLGAFNFYQDTVPFFDTISQNGTLQKPGWSLNWNANYTEPLGKNAQIQITAGQNYSRSNSEKYIRAFSEITSGFTQLDSALSNDFRSIYENRFIGLGYRWQHKIMQINVGANYQQSTLLNDQEFPRVFNTEYAFNNLLPNAMLMFRFNSSSNLRVFYRTNVNAPSIDQLQEVINNNNPIQLSIGNAQLDQEYRHGMFIRYSGTNAQKGHSFFAMMGGSTTLNYIGNAVTTFFTDSLLNEQTAIPAGAQLTKPINLGGQFSIRSYINYSFPVKAIKSNIQINGGVNYSETPGLVNNIAIYTGNFGRNMGLGISSNISEKLDFNIQYRFTATTALGAGTKSTNNNHNAQFKFNWMPWKGWVIASDINFIGNNGLSGSLNQQFTLWNAGLGYKFLKDQKGELRIIAYDLLKQNNSIIRNISETYFEDQQSNIVQRYFMLQFTYQIRYWEKKETGKN